MDCKSENPSVPPSIRFVEPEKSRTFKRKRQWDRFKLSFSNALHAVTPGGKRKPLRTPSQLRHSFQSSTERTEDVSSEFFLTKSEHAIEVELFSPLTEAPEKTSLVTKPAIDSETSSDETNDSTTGEQNDGESSALEETNQLTEQETRRPSLKRMNSWLVHAASKQVNFRIEKDFQSQAMSQTKGLKQPCYLSLEQMNTFDELPTFPRAPDLPCDRRKQFAQTKSIGSEKWELSIPTIDEEKSFEFLSSRLERRSALFLKSEGPIEPEPKRVERRNAIAIHTEKPKLTQQPNRKRTKRRKEIITNLEELERFQPKSSKMERRNAIVIHIDSWELSRSYSNKMERRNAIIIHDHDHKLVQFKAKRKKGKQKRSKSKRIHTRQFSTARNQGTNGNILEHRCKFSIRGVLLAVSGIMVAVFVAALPIMIDDFFVMQLQTTRISLTSQQNDCVYDDIMLGKASERNDSQLLGGAQFIETDLSPQKIINLNMDEAKNFLRELDFFDLPLF